MYKRLIKIIKDDAGAEMCACVNYDTDRCLLHKVGGCQRCPMMAVILNQLYAFEELFCEKSDSQNAN